MKKETIIILVLILLLVGTLSYFGFEKYNDAKEKKRKEKRLCSRA